MCQHKVCAVPRIPVHPLTCPDEWTQLLCWVARCFCRNFKTKIQISSSLVCFSALLDTLSLCVRFLTYACHLKTIYMCFRFVCHFRSHSIAWCLKMVSTQHFSFSCHLNVTFDPSQLCHLLFPSKLPLCISAWRRTYGAQDINRVSVKVHSRDSFFCFLFIATSYC